MDRPIAHPIPHEPVRLDTLRAGTFGEASIASAIERDRMRIAQLFHHTVCQSFSGIQLMANVIARKFQDTDPAAASEFAEFERYVRRAVNDLHVISDWLKPVPTDHGDLVAALNKVAEQAKAFVPCVFNCSLSRIATLDSIRVARLVQIASNTIFCLLSRKDVTEVNLSLSDARGELVFTLDAKGPELGENVDSPFAPEWGLLKYHANLIGASVQVSTNGGTTIHVVFTNRNES